MQNLEECFGAVSCESNLDFQTAEESNIAANPALANNEEINYSNEESALLEGTVWPNQCEELLMGLQSPNSNTASDANGDLAVGDNWYGDAMSSEVIALQSVPDTSIQDRASGNFSNVPPAPGLEDYDANLYSAIEDMSQFDSSVHNTPHSDGAAPNEHGSARNMGRARPRYSLSAETHNDQLAWSHETHTTNAQPLAPTPPIVQEGWSTEDLPWKPISAVKSYQGQMDDVANWYLNDQGGLDATMAVSEPSHDYSSISRFTVGDTETTGTSFNPMMGDSTATLQPLSNVNDMFQVWQQGSTVSAEDVNVDSYSRMDEKSLIAGIRNASVATDVHDSWRPKGQHLSVPQVEPNAGDPPSPTPSITPSHEPAVMMCLKEGCHKSFKGMYRRGNLHRHMRLKHDTRRGEEEREYPCNCGKVFKRQDARLKHLRKKHPELGLRVAESRRSGSSH